MSSPNVFCQVYYLENEKSLAKNKIREEKYGKKRKFYSCNNRNNYVDYVQSGSKRGLDYVEYSGDNEKSSGVFNGNGILTEAERKALKKQLRQTDSVIWHGFISFTEEFGAAYCNDYESAYRMMKTEFPRFLKSAGLNPDNVVWYVGFHENTDNRHIHFSFFEKEPTRYRERSKHPQYSNGRLPKYSFEQFKLRAERKLTDAASQLKLARRMVTDRSKNVLFSKDSGFAANNEIRALMLNLLDGLPKEGRLSYDSENMRPLKPQIDRIADLLILSDKKLYSAYVGFCRTVSDEDRNTRRILSGLKIPEKQWERYLVSEKYIADLHRRIGNQVINALRVYRGKLKSAKTHKADKRIRRSVRFGLLAYSAKLNAIAEREAAEAFEEYYRKITDRDIYAETEEELAHEME